MAVAVAVIFRLSRLSPPVAFHSLSHNSLGPMGGVAIAEGLKASHTLEVLE